MRGLLLAAVAAVVLSGCVTHVDYEEPILFSCGYLTGDNPQDVCHASLYRVPAEERSADMVDAIRRSLEIEGD